MGKTDQFCCENVLWMPWRHKGDMKALTEIDLTTLDADKFVGISTKHDDAYTCARKEAFRFAEGILSLASFDERYVTDVPRSVMMKRQGLLSDFERELGEAEDIEAELC